ncbi:MAG: Snf7 family protein [Desulfurococcales archaeon]|nr:Snf7 family protein [Desulfurococcales archaeon]
MVGYESWAKKWRSEPTRVTIGRKLKNAVSPPGPLRAQIIQAAYKISSQINRLEYSIAKLQSYDKQLFEKVVNAIIDGDKTRAAMYANEIVEIRKMAKVIMTVKYALERVKIRLDTALIVGDTHAHLAPAVVALKQVAGYLRGMMPDVFTELLEVDESLQTTLMATTAAAPELISATHVSEEAQKIIKEASLVAEQRLKEKFPELPKLDITAPEASGIPGATIEEGK